MYAFVVHIDIDRILLSYSRISEEKNLIKKNIEQNTVQMVLEPNVSIEIRRAY